MTTFIKFIIGSLMAIGGMGTLMIGIAYKDSMLLMLGPAIIFAIPITLAALEFDSKKRFKPNE